MQGKFTTDCDGSVRHEKWQEPAGTLLVALTAYKTKRTNLWHLCKYCLCAKFWRRNFSKLFRLHFFPYTGSKVIQEVFCSTLSHSSSVCQSSWIGDGNCFGDNFATFLRTFSPMKQESALQRANACWKNRLCRWFLGDRRLFCSWVKTTIVFLQRFECCSPVALSSFECHTSTWFGGKITVYSFSEEIKHNFVCLGDESSCSVVCFW